MFGDLMVSAPRNRRDKENESKGQQEIGKRHVVAFAGSEVCRNTKGTDANYGKAEQKQQQADKRKNVLGHLSG